MNEKVRLGYACVNMTLTNRPKKLGGRVTTSRTARKASWHPNWDLSLIGERAVLNATDLLHYLKWNEENNIKLFRVGSELVPWHDHFELHELPQYDELAAKLLECGNYAREHGHRLTTHPGPFHVLGSPHEHVVEKSIIGLERHSELWDLMGYAPSHENKINIHIGAAYGDKPFALDNFCRNFERLPDNVRSRLTVENDDKVSLYSTQELYDGVYRRIGIPIVFDYHHHMLHPGGQSEQEALELALSTWGDIKPVVHYAESRSIEYNNPKIKPQAHSDMIRNPFDDYGHDLDVMIEAKHKELALLEYRVIMNEQRMAV